jgi:hypothetical protein
MIEPWIPKRVSSMDDRALNNRIPLHMKEIKHYGLIVLDFGGKSYCKTTKPLLLDSLMIEPCIDDKFFYTS